MLTPFMNFRVADVPDVTIFRDHADPQQFYVIPERPRIATDARTNLPVFAFTLFSRNVDIAYAAAKDGIVESQLGQLELTVDLSITDEELKKIQAYCTTMLTEEMSNPSSYNKLYRVSTTANRANIGYPSWQEGTCKLVMLEGSPSSFKKSSSSEVKPSLEGANTAALWASLGTEGAQLLWETLKKKAGPAGGAVETSSSYATVYYSVKILSRLPALRVTVKANGKTVYEEIRKKTTVMETDGKTTFTYPQISELTKSLKDTRAIDIQWEDWGIPDSEKPSDFETKLESEVLNIITQQIASKFFSEFQVKGIQDDDLGETFTHLKIGAKGSRLWLNDYKEEWDSDMGFTFERSNNYVFEKAPQGSLLVQLADEQIDKLVRVVDVGTPEVQFMTINAYTNADFVADSIAQINVSLSYRQFDVTTQKWEERADSFVFRTGKEVFTFHLRLARDGKGKLIDKYDAKAQVFYVGADDRQKAIELKNVTERALTFSYARLGYVKVDVQAGDIDWSQIDRVFIDFVYDSASDQPDAKKSIELNEKHLSDVWICSKHDQTSNRYSYKVRYHFKNGDEVSSASVSDERGSLAIHDTLVGRLRRTFDVVMDSQTVDSVLVKVRYDDPPNPLDEERHTFTGTGSWDFVRALRQGGPQALRFGYTVQYKDMSEDVPEVEIQPTDDLPTIKVRRYRFSIYVDGGGVDWTKWRVVIVELTYRDDAHGYVKIDDAIRVTQADNLKSMEVQAFAPDARSYEYRVKFVPKDPSLGVLEFPAGGGAATGTGLLLLETLTTPPHV
jgi:hypothetical protein